MVFKIQVAEENDITKTAEIELSKTALSFNRTANSVSR